MGLPSPTIPDVDLQTSRSAEERLGFVVQSGGAEERFSAHSGFAILFNRKPVRIIGVESGDPVIRPLPQHSGLHWRWQERQPKIHALPHRQLKHCLSSLI